MEKDLVKQDEAYLALAEEIKSTVKEYVQQSRWALVEGYWNVGKLIREKHKGGGITKVLQGLGVHTGLSETTLWYAVQVFDKYPQLNALPEGNNISWNKLITKYLPEASIGKKDLGKCVFCDKDKYDDGQLNVIALAPMEDGGKTYFVHKPCLWFFLKTKLK